MIEADERLILWDPEFVLDWLWRTETYRRLRERANDGTPAISVQVFGEVLYVLRMRRMAEARFHDLIDEIVDHLALIDLTPGRAEVYGEVVGLCRRSELDVAREAWFAWQVALVRREGCRVMTKAPSRYAGLISRDHLA